MFITPMRVQRQQVDVFDDDEFIYEPSIDGHRLILSQCNQNTQLYTANGRNVTLIYPELFHISIAEDLVLDGEVALVNPSTGLIDRESVQERLSLRNIRDIREKSKQHPVNFIVFDILYKGRDLRGFPLTKRKDILSHLELGNRYIGKIPFIEGNGMQMFREVQARKMEGMVAKRMDSPYSLNRPEDWLKTINWQVDEFYITGYQKENFTLLLSLPDQTGGYKEVGTVSTGFTAAHKMTFYMVSSQLEVKQEDGVIYVMPYIRAQIRFRNYTWAGKLRGAEFVKFIV